MKPALASPSLDLNRLVDDHLWAVEAPFRRGLVGNEHSFTVPAVTGLRTILLIGEAEDRGKSAYRSSILDPGR